MHDGDRAPPAGPVLILTPTGRDADVAAGLLAAEGIGTTVVPTLKALQAALDDTAGMVLLADEAVIGADTSVLAAWLAAQPPWSDLPFVVLTRAGTAVRRPTTGTNLAGTLGNVLFLERPLQALSLVSAVKSALRARQRQRQVRDYLAAQVGAAERAAALLEERVRERTAALEAADAERRQMAAALAQAQKMEAVGQLTGGLAHDLNNMLAGIIGGLSLMQTRLAKGQITQLDRYITMAQHAAHRAAGLTHRLLAFSRRQTLEPKPTGVNRLVTDMLDLVRSTIGPGITIETALADEPWLTLCDPHQLENALLNLCINARDAMPQGGRLLIETANTHLTPDAAARLREAGPGDYVTLGVTDTGTGIPPEVIARVFDPFFTTKPQGEGTGLGLSMVYGFLHQSGGHVQIVSDLGQGTTVRLYLPRHDGAEETTAAGPAPLAARPLGRHETVLVVDDEPAVRTVVTEVLRTLGCEPLEAPDGPAGLRLLKSSPGVALLVADMGLPGGMNGQQLADAARRERPGLKVLFITGYAEATRSRGGWPGPGAQVMTKPFALDALANRIRELLPGP
ncbi:ATP-binding protein [Rhodopila globiformis]|uniref:histidine kinase n=1 Tax=Rhodopila globiformis TaxID=1071 RepID=A0A2S6N154_RHOGL|nr:ATP-binding protein [Rhodopila globiformis]PPQ28316.1 hybrid sensor histidine kinase/response regulator [Rhodopila globiformis]